MQRVTDQWVEQEVAIYHAILPDTEWRQIQQWAHTKIKTMSTHFEYKLTSIELTKLR